MAVSAVFSLPLLVLHVSRVLNLGFAVTRVLPLAVFTLGLVIDGVYGGRFRDYIFIGAVVIVMGCLTVTYRGWTAHRDERRRERLAVVATLRKTLATRLRDELGRQLAQLAAAEGQAAALLKSFPEGEASAMRSRLESAREPVAELRKAHADLLKHVPAAPLSLNWWDEGAYRVLEGDIEAFAERLELALSHLRAEIEYVERSLAPGRTAGEGEVHCVACGHVVPDAPFCQRCGAPRAVAVCAMCGQETVIPLHLVPAGEQVERIHCANCGARLSVSSQSSPGTTSS
jgi:hypothetical protein